MRYPSVKYTAELCDPCQKKHEEDYGWYISTAQIRINSINVCMGHLVEDFRPEVLDIADVEIIAPMPDAGV